LEAEGRARAPSWHPAWGDLGRHCDRRLLWRGSRPSRAPCEPASLPPLSSSEDRARVTPARSPRRASGSSRAGGPCPSAAPRGAGLAAATVLLGGASASHAGALASASLRIEPGWGSLTFPG